jgi:hypothetical protein
VGCDRDGVPRSDADLRQDGTATTWRPRPSLFTGQIQTLELPPSARDASSLGMYVHTKVCGHGSHGEIMIAFAASSMWHGARPQQQMKSPSSISPLPRRPCLTALQRIRGAPFACTAEKAKPRDAVDTPSRARSCEPILVRDSFPTTTGRRRLVSLVRATSIQQGKLRGSLETSTVKCLFFLISRMISRPLSVAISSSQGLSLGLA